MINMLSYALKTMLISSQIFCFKAHFYVDFKDQAWDNDRHAISLDFIKAFDMVWHSYSEEQLIKMPIPDNIRIIDNWQYLIIALCQIRAMHLYLIETYLPPLKDVCINYVISHVGWLINCCIVLTDIFVYLQELAQ